MNNNNQDQEASLDPTDWTSVREQGHRMLDDMLDYLQQVRQRPVWQPAPNVVRERLQVALPQQPSPLAEVHQQFMTDILPYAVGNTHPGFMGWVHGGGTVVGMLAEMLSAGLNANVGGRNQMPVEVERQITRWMAALYDFPPDASGVFVTGTSMANLVALWVARTRYLGVAVRQHGVAHAPQCLMAYASTATHGSFALAMDLAGLGTDKLRRVPVDTAYRMDRAVLQRMIDEDRTAGYQPFMLVGNAGTVDTGAIDPLAELATVAAAENMWFHVDGALGALGMLSTELAPLFDGIQRADSIAFDFHKWGQVPYDAGFIMVRNGEMHRSTFAAPAAYLRREADGLASGSPWPCDFGPDLSRGFRALKTWFTLQVYGAEQMGQVMAHTCAVARYLASRIAACEKLELMAPVVLNIVCFRYRCSDMDRVNAAIAVAVQNTGVSAPSTTVLDGCLVIRAAIVNHRTMNEDVDALFDAVLHWGGVLSQGES